MACHSYENESPINSERYLFLSRLRPSIFLPECTERCIRASSFVARRRKTYPILLPSPWQMPVDGLMRRHPGSSLNIQWRQLREGRVFTQLQSRNSVSRSSAFLCVCLSLNRRIMSIRCILTWILGTNGYRQEGPRAPREFNRMPTGTGFQREMLSFFSSTRPLPTPLTQPEAACIFNRRLVTLLQFEPRARIPHLHTVFLLLFSSLLRRKSGGPSKKPVPKIETRPRHPMG